MATILRSPREKQYKVRRKTLLRCMSEANPKGYIVDSWEWLRATAPEVKEVRHCELNVGGKSDRAKRGSYQ